MMILRKVIWGCWLWRHIEFQTQKTRIYRRSLWSIRDSRSSLMTTTRLLSITWPEYGKVFKMRRACVIFREIRLCYSLKKCHKKCCVQSALIPHHLLLSEIGITKMCDLIAGFSNRCSRAAPGILIIK